MGTNPNTGTPSTSGTVLDPSGIQEIGTLGHDDARQLGAPGFEQDTRS